jgi:spermidine synthase
MDSGIYFKEGSVIAESGLVKVYSYNNDIFLEVGPAHTLWALGSELDDYMEQLYDHPFGSVLEIGLGLGIASRYILTLPKVRTLTTVEQNSDVINTYGQLLEKDTSFIKNFGYKKHLILNTDGLAYLYATKRKYDFVFLDFYRAIDEETMPDIEDMVLGAKRILAPGGKIMGWFDKYTPDEYTNKFYSLFE